MGATQTPQGLRMRHESNEEYLEWLSRHTGTSVERIWDPVILVHAPIANLWSPFVFYRDGEFSHCGVNNVSLIRTDDGWRIANWIWTEETEGCPSSPLGPLAGG